MTTTPPPALLFDRSMAQGRIELTDRDRFDLLHRLSTNDLARFSQGEGRPTVLTTALARIIDRVIVYHRGESGLMLTHYPATVLNWLRRHIFWNDRVKLRDVSAELGQWELHGPTAEALAEGVIRGAAGLPLHAFVEDAGRGLFVARTFALQGAGYVLIGPPDALDAARQSLIGAGAAIGTPEQYESLRIAAGLPGPNTELTEDYIPLEAGLWDSVSFSKGCYIGQEIIARMESRNKLAKTLVGLKLAGSVARGAILQAEGETVGVLTSIAPVEAGGAVGLGFVKPDRAVIGARLTALPEGGDPVRAEIVPAPLIASRN